MKNIISAFILIFVLISNAHVCCAWQRYNDSEINKLFSLNNRNPEVEKIESGKNWVKINSPISGNIYGIYFIDSIIGWAVGGGKKIIKTTNGGIEWILQNNISITENIDFIDISFYGQNYGWILGKHLIMRTTNGGKDWDYIKFSQYDDLFKICFVDSLHGWLSGSFRNPGPHYPDGLIFSTTDGGKTWERKTIRPANVYEFDIYDVKFADKNHGFAVGQGVIYSTTDGGKNWFENIKNTQYLNAIHFIDSANGWVVGAQAYPYKLLILKTTDGGSSWVNTIDLSNNMGYGVFFTDIFNGWIILSDGKILKTTDSGETWLDDNSPITQSLNSLFFINSSSGWAVGNNGTMLKYSSEPNTDVINKASDNNFTISPNPAENIINIRFNNNHVNIFQIEIYGIMGNLCYNNVFTDLQRGNINLPIDLTHFSSGIHFVKLNAGGKTYCKVISILK